jgi:hypothetical protein
MRRVGVIVVAALALALAPGAAAAVKNPCALVTSAEAGKALSVKVGAGDHEKKSVFDTCTYGKGRKSLVIQTRKISQSGFRSAIRHIPGTALNAADVDPNAWVSFITNGIALTVWKGGKQLNLRIVGAGDNASVLVKDVAFAALKRL